MKRGATRIPLPLCPWARFDAAALAVGLAVVAMAAMGVEGKEAASLAAESGPVSVASGAGDLVPAGIAIARLPAFPDVPAVPAGPPVLVAPASRPASAAGGGSPGDSPAAPYLDRRAEPLEYDGPGRDDPDPPGLTEFLMGWFGPSDPADPAGGDFWTGASMAAAEINSEGGVRGLPIRLVPRWSASPWTAGAGLVVRLAYQDRVQAILGSIDGAATHLAEQVAAKALIPLLSPGSTDKTVSFAGVPWMFTLLPGDDVQAKALAAWISGRPRPGPVTFLSATDHDSRAAAAEWRSAFLGAGVAPAAELQCDPGASGAQALAAGILEAAPAAVVLLASPLSSGRLASALRQAGYRGAILGGSSLSRREFAQSAGAAAEGAVFPLLYDPSSEDWKRFEGRFAARAAGALGPVGSPSAGAIPDFAAGSGYDAVRFLAEAARRAGPNRARIRDAFRDLSPWRGVTGEVRFDNLGRNLRAVGIGTLRAGRIVALTPGPLPGRRPPD